MPYKDPEKHREANRLKAQRHRNRHPGAAAAAAKKWRLAHPEKAIDVNRRALLKANYDLTLEDVERMFVDQAGLCDSCGHEISLIPGTPNFRRVDHDHDTEEVRGLLCDGCNKAAGLLHDCPDRCRALAQYLEKHKCL